MVDLGSLITAADVDDAITRVLEADLPAAIDWVADRAGVTITHPRSYALRQDLEDIPEDKFPTVVVVTYDAEVTRNAGRLDATWDVAVGVFVDGRGPEAARQRVMRMAAAVRTVLAQNRTLGGVVDRVNVVAEGFGVVEFERSRTLAGASVTLEVLTTGVTDLDPPDDSPLVVAHHEDIDPLGGDSA